jgi:hypothetical protein
VAVDTGEHGQFDIMKTTGNTILITGGGSRPASTLSRLS